MERDGEVKEKETQEHIVQAQRDYGLRLAGKRIPPIALGTWSWGGHAPPSPPLLLSHPEPPPFTPRSVMNRLRDLRSLYFFLSCASVFSSAKWETNSDLAGTLGGSYEKKKKHENV